MDRLRNYLKKLKQKIMKLHQLIFATTAIFTLLFYDENIGLNLGILGIILSMLVLWQTKERNRDKIFLLLFVFSILSSVAFAWYADFASFLAEISSILLLRFKSKNRNLKFILSIPSYISGGFTFINDLFQFSQWFPKSKNTNTSKKIVAFVLIPILFVSVFFGVYSLGSNHFSELFSEYEWNLNFFNLFFISILGFFFAFIFWNLLIPRVLFKQNQHLKNDFSEGQKISKPTYTFLDVDYERTSGVISLIALNILLLVFISTYSYEQFYETTKSGAQLSSETHDGVNAIILSIIMAILVILFYFKSGFNFDNKAKYLKLFAKIWIILNVVLIFSTVLKNTEYIRNFGFTYKRLGVYAFLILSILGLIFTFIKIKNQKTNVYLFNKMFGCFFGIILLCSYINWGGIITSENMKRQDFALNFHKNSINFNEKQLLNYAKKHENKTLEESIKKNIEKKQKTTFLSKILYYESINTNEESK